MVIPVIMVALVVVMTPLIVGLLCTAHFISTAKVIRNHRDHVMGVVAGDHSQAWRRRSAFGGGHVVRHHYLMSETEMIRSPAPHVEAY
ncbi:hypothetical protein K1719_037569 [Acacia pycnantha]|nr:hypothetical protein K1719_037569 [Acacia pycnantha]